MNFRMQIITTLVLILIAISFAFWRASLSPSKLPQATPFHTSAPVSSPAPSTNPDSAPLLDLPIADFYNRIIKKPFGIYVTPQNSPVQPERFTGYHTGADVEYGDVTADVPVYAIANGKVLLARTAQGYGGVALIHHEINGEVFNSLYGHIRPSSLPAAGSEIKKGQQIGVLGTAFSSETDGERRHLHFAVLKNNNQSLLGYVPKKSELSNWYDPVEFMKNH